MNNIDKAASIIKNGGLVAFPTETVYGLGADARNDKACLNIFRAKNRPNNNPLIVHVASIEEAKTIAHFNEDALRLSKLWPGPLSLVLTQKSDSHIAHSVSAGLSTIAIRIPSNHTALELIRTSNCPIAAPSANRSGRLSTTTYKHVKENFHNKNSLDEIFILNSEYSPNCGLESTIVDLTTNTPTILRYGFITPETIESTLGKKIAIYTDFSTIKAPGMLHRHYAPRTKLRKDAINLVSGEIGLNFFDSQLEHPKSLNLSVKGDLTEASLNLFNYLNQLDHFAITNNINTIAVAPIPKHGLGLTINDRLTRAAE